MKDENGQTFVYVSENNVAKKHLITIGKEYGGHSEITSGLKEGDMLVNAGYDLINEGTALTINK
jgi:multidrug efflux pump subunit AcrA (membrane-fusion protein)